MFSKTQKRTVVLSVLTFVFMLAMSVVAFAEGDE